MALACRLFDHDWDGCTCKRCNATREHEWDGCTCRRCNAAREHDWHGCICFRCPATQDKDHNWGYTCECCMCGMTRNTSHAFNGCKCAKCKDFRDMNHIWEAGRCTRCFRLAEGDIRSTKLSELHVAALAEKVRSIRRTFAKENPDTFQAADPARGIPSDHAAAIQLFAMTHLRASTQKDLSRTQSRLFSEYRAGELHVGRDDDGDFLIWIRVD
jgi:hypothetical protein